VTESERDAVGGALCVSGKMGRCLLPQAARVAPGLPRRKGASHCRRLGRVGLGLVSSTERRLGGAGICMLLLRFCLKVWHLSVNHNHMYDLRTMSPSVSLPDVFRGLRDAVAAWGGRRLLGAVLVALLWRRLGEVSGRLERMMVRFAAGRPMVRGARAVSGSIGAAGGAAEVLPGDRAAGVARERVWPTGFGWLCKAAAHEAAGFGGHLRHVLAHPEIVALLRASPEARRLLRPVCRALAIEASVLSPLLPGEVRPEPVVVKVPRKRVRAKKPKVDWGNIPMPRGIFAMVKKYKKQGRW
jgi:hypothetical protein